MDFPLANHFDDSDCMVLFDNVLVPWERNFIYRDIEAYNAAQRRTHTHTHTSHQFTIKDLAKAEFMRDLAITVARSTNVDGFLHIQNMLGELIQTAEWVEARIRTSELGPDIERYFQSANNDAHDRIRLFRLACDAALTSFSGRQQLYERYFAGDPVRSQASYANAFDKEPSMARINAVLDRWEAGRVGLKPTPTSIRNSGYQTRLANICEKTADIHKMLPPSPQRTIIHIHSIERNLGG